MKSKNKHTKHLPKNQIAEIYGWFGSILILSAYALLSFGIVDSESLIYHSFFFVGSSGLAVITYRHRAFQSFTVNIFFTILAFFAILRIIYFA